MRRSRHPPAALVPTLAPVGRSHANPASQATAPPAGGKRAVCWRNLAPLPDDEVKGARAASNEARPRPGAEAVPLAPGGTLVFTNGLDTSSAEEGRAALPTVQDERSSLSVRTAPWAATGRSVGGAVFAKGYGRQGTRTVRGALWGDAADSWSAVYTAAGLLALRCATVTANRSPAERMPRGRVTGALRCTATEEQESASGFR